MRSDFGRIYPGKAKHRILELLQGGNKTSREISEQLQLPLLCVCTRMTELKNVGRVEKIFHGYSMKRLAVHKWRLRA